MSERILSVDGIDLCAETFGDADDPAMLLIAGMAQSMDSWEDAFCERLAAGSRFVIRYDQRDTGRTTTCPVGAPDYTADDLVDDAAGLLDALGIREAHVVGISMGGAMAQLLALRHPRRVATLTLLSTCAVTPTSDGSSLPPIGRDLPAPPAEPDWSDRAAIVDYIVESNRGYVPSDFDEDRTRALAERTLARTPDVRPQLTNHALLADGEPRDERIADVAVPTLVIHGSADPLFPLPHGEALARAIPGAALLVLDGVGHEVPPPRTWDTVVPAILRLGSRG